MLVQEMVEVIPKVDVVAKLQEGVTTKPIKVEDGSIEIILRLADVAVRVVIEHSFMLFCLILK